MARSPGQRSANVSRTKSEKVTRIGLIQELLAKCTNQQDGNEEKDLLVIHSLIEQLISIEKDFEINLPNRCGKFEKFIQWVTENGLDTSRIEVTEIDAESEEYGLRCKRFDLKEGELIMEIPRKLMLTNEIGANKCDANFENFAKSDLMMKTMPNVRLAMVLMNEYSSRDSFWKPYLDILPSKYTNHPLYMDVNGLLSLKPSPSFVEAIKLLKSCTRQYCYFYTQMMVPQSPAPKSCASQLSFRKNFTFNFYRWGVVTTMTRQNLIPASSSKDANGSLSVNALIPVWDLCNHSQGQFSTDFSPETNSALCYAMKPFPVGSEISIFYGPRCNGEFFIHNGFVFPENCNDFLPIKLGISKSDPLYQMKSILCSKCGLQEVGVYNLKPKDQGMDPKMHLFLRIFHADKDELEACMKEDDPIARLKDKDSMAEVDHKVDAFIRTRASLLDRSYESSEEFRVQGSVQWRLVQSERKILKSYLLA